MTQQDIASAMRRVEGVLQRRADLALRDDPPASARWEGGTRVLMTHPNGAEVATEMRSEFGGTDGRLSPGWVFRAGLASCAATSIAMLAALEGLELASLEVQVGSRTDTRGLLGMRDADGETVYPGPSEVHVHVRLGAPGVSAQRLHALVEEAMRRSPLPNAVQNPTPLSLHIDLL